MRKLSLRKRKDLAQFPQWVQGKALDRTWSAALVGSLVGDGESGEVLYSRNQQNIVKQLYSNKNHFWENEEQRNKYRAQSLLGIWGFARLRDNYFQLTRYTEFLNKWNIYKDVKVTYVSVCWYAPSTLSRSDSILGPEIYLNQILLDLIQTRVDPEP